MQTENKELKEEETGKLKREAIKGETGKRETGKKETGKKEIGKKETAEKEIGKAKEKKENISPKGGCTASKLFRLTEEAVIQLKKKSTEKGITESAYVRMLIMDSPKEYPEIRQELAKLNNEINHIGVNINQIAKNNNSYLYLESDKLKLLTYMKHLKQLAYEINKKLDQNTRIGGDSGNQ